MKTYPFKYPDSNADNTFNKIIPLITFSYSPSGIVYDTEFVIDTTNIFMNIKIIEDFKNANNW